MRRNWLLAFAGTFLLLFSVGHGSIENTDCNATMHAARALLLRGDSGVRTPGQGAEWLGEAALARYVRDSIAAGKPSYGKVGRNDLVYVWFPVGHLWLMVPTVAVGEALSAVFPAVEERFREIAAPGGPAAATAANESYRDGHLVFPQAVSAMLPALFGAGSVLLLFLIARRLGADRRGALVSTVAIAIGTQFFALARESLSDGPGMFFVLATLLLTLRACSPGDVSGRRRMWWLLLGGCMAGFAVLTRTAHAMFVPFFGLAVALSAWRRRRVLDVLWFALGGVPALALLMLVNWLRYGDVTDTGYPEASSWMFNYPLHLGLTKVLFAAGKGLLWFSPLLLLAVPLGLRRRGVPVAHRWLAWVLFVVPLLVFASSTGWQSGQCWGIRYITPGIVCLLAILIPQLQPWTSHRRLFLALCMIGALVNLTGMVAPVRGYNQLADQAVRAHYQREFEAGRISSRDWLSVQQYTADHYFFAPRFSPLHANWTYAWKSMRGDFEDAQGRRQDGSENTIEPLFGAEARTKQQAEAPRYWEDRHGRHLWWGFWADLYGLPRWLLLLPVLGLGAALSLVGWRGVLRAT